MPSKDAPPGFQTKPIHLSFASLSLLFPAFYLLVAISSTPAQKFPLISATQPNLNATGDILMAIADAALGPFNLALGWRELCAQSLLPEGQMGAWICTEKWDMPTGDSPLTKEGEVLNVQIIATNSPVKPEDRRRAPHKEIKAKRGDAPQPQAPVDTKHLTALIAAGPTAVGILSQSLKAVDGVQYFLVSIPVATGFAGFAAIWKFLSVLSTYPFLLAHHQLPGIFAHRGLGYFITVVATTVTVLAWVLLGSGIAAAQSIAIGAIAPLVVAGSAGYILTLVMVCQVIALVLGWREYSLTAPLPPSQCMQGVNQQPFTTTIQSVNLRSGFVPQSRASRAPSARYTPRHSIPPTRISGVPATVHDWQNNHYVIGEDLDDMVDFHDDDTRIDMDTKRHWVDDAAARRSSIAKY